jgi:hypothetical protein
MHKIILCVIVLSGSNLYAKEIEKRGEELPPKKGNFALPAALQPIKLFGNQQTMVDKGDLVLFNGLANNKGSDATKVWLPGFVYGMMDTWSVYFAVPVILEEKEKGFQSSGVGDASFLTEFALYSRTSRRSAQLWTLQATMSFPTGNPLKVPSTGLGYPTWTLATLFTHMTVKFFCGAGLWTTLHSNFNGSREGHTVNYNLAMGYNLGHPMRGILCGLLELDGIHKQRDVITCVKNPLSGGNLVYLGPSLFWSFSNVILQTGIQFPVMQHFRDPTERFGYRAALLVAWVL